MFRKVGEHDHEEVLDGIKSIIQSQIGKEPTVETLYEVCGIAETSMPIEDFRKLLSLGKLSAVGKVDKKKDKAKLIFTIDVSQFSVWDKLLEYGENSYVKSKSQSN